MRKRIRHFVVSLAYLGAGILETLLGDGPTVTR